MRYLVKSGRHHRGGHIFSKGDTFEAEPHQVQYILDQIEPVKELTPELPATGIPQEPAPLPSEHGLKAVHAGYGRWNVLNTETGEKINDTALTKEEAQKMATV